MTDVDAAEAGPWDGSEPLECTMVIPEAPDVRSFAFTTPSGSWFKYRPGQFITLELPVPGGPLHRTYTISSTPSRPLSLSVTVKAQKGSIGSRWMIDNLKPGDLIKATPPMGIFTLPKATTGKKFLFIAAGSGITPMKSMLSYLYDTGVEPDARLIMCAKKPSELIFRDVLQQFSARMPGIGLSFVVSEPDRYGIWTGFQGRFNQLMLGLMAPDYLEREVYCCGPEDFMTSVREMLIGFGFDMDHYHQESFHAPPVETKADQPELDDVVPDESQAAEITFAKSGVTTPCVESDTILYAARAAGLNIPSGCTFGICGTCKVKKLSGEVLMVHNGGIADEDVEEGYILACCSNPIGKVEIDV